jgi:hypothetical protein
MAFRTQSATRQNQDSSRSHAVFIMNIQQINRKHGKRRESRLYMIDLAGSEQGRSKSSRQLDNPVALESRMVNASLQSVHNLIRAKLVEQGNGKGRINPSNAYANVSQLTKLLKPCLGGNFYTTFICTVSPSSYNIGETVNTIKFGSKVRNLMNNPREQIDDSFEGCRKRLVDAEEQIDNLSRFAITLAFECRTLRKTGKVRQPHNNKVWDAISKIVKSCEDHSFSNLRISMLRKDEIELDLGKELPPSEREQMETKLNDHELARTKAESKMHEYQSEVTSLRAQHDVESKEIQRLERELMEANDEIKAIGRRQIELQNELRTTKFRENEAVVFLRQFRSFYLRLLKNKAAQGSGDTKQVVEEQGQKIVGAPDLTGLLDIDRLMVESGLLEDDEIGKDANQSNYSPSNIAVQRSALQAKEAEEREMAIMQGTSIIQRPDDAKEISYRQRLTETPAGKLAIQKEKEIEKELIDLSTKCTVLRNSVIAEKAMVEALYARQGALSKMNAARETSMLKSELERKTNDLHAIIWKMNELHLVNKTIDEKVESRDQHVLYLEEQLAKLQYQNRILHIEKTEALKRMREECSALQKELDGASIGLWQLGETRQKHMPKCRIIVPSSGNPFSVKKENSPTRRMSLGDISVEDLTLLDPPGMNTSTTASTQTEEVSTTDLTTQAENGTLTDASIQTDERSNLISDGVEIAVQTDDEEKESPENMKAGVSTVDASVQTNNELSNDVSVHTEHDTTIEPKASSSISNASTQTLDNYSSHPTKPPSAEIAIQTDPTPDALPIHTIQLPEQINHSWSNPIDAESLDLGEEGLSKPSEEQRPPKPNKAFENRRANIANISASSDISPHGSNTSLDFQKAVGVEEKLGSSMRWRSPPSPAAKHVQERLGSSMSVLQSTPGKVSDWRAMKNSRKPPPRKKSGSNDIPEFLTKFKQMGIKADENEPELDPNSSAAKLRAASAPTEVPEFLNRFKQMGIKSDDNEEEEAAADNDAGGGKEKKLQPLESKPHEPEWMEKFKKIGMKVDEGIVIVSGGKGSGVEKTQSFNNSKRPGRFTSNKR